MRISKVELIRFGEITEQFAIEEGDGNLDNWLTIHEFYYSKQLSEIGKGLNFETLLVCEWFELVD